MPHSHASMPRPVVSLPMALPTVAAAPRERVSTEEIRQQARQLSEADGFINLLDAIPTPLLVLNASRQVLFANRASKALLIDQDLTHIYGLRPGEAIGCNQAHKKPTGCGTAEACAACGAARVITACERGGAAAADCRITQQGSGRGLDLRVAASPFRFGEASLSVLSITDMSHENRRHALERVFFHDLLNTLGAVSGCAELLPLATPEEIPELRRSILQAVQTMAEEIRAHRDLVAAENGELAVIREAAGTRDILARVTRLLRTHDAAKARTIVIAEDSAEVEFPTDRVLVARVLGNLLKNALEASSAAEAVTLGCQATEEEVIFRVHNLGAIPPLHQLQVFQRSFSTKGRGRGLGTYSVKLLTERYLKGRVWFSSSIEAGTTFYAAYPRQA